MRSSGTVRPNTTSHIKSEASRAVKSESRAKVKSEDTADAMASEFLDQDIIEDDFDDDADTFFSTPDAPVLLDKFEPAGMSGDDLFLKNSNPETLEEEEFNRFYLFQLPTKLPAGQHSESMEPPSDAPEVVRVDEGAGAADSDGFRGKLGNLGTGHVGKLRVHASGKCSLLLGGCRFEVTEGMLASFRQEVALIHASTRGVKKEDTNDADETDADADEEEEGMAQSASNAIFYLGNVTHKVNVIPDYKQLFEERQRLKIEKQEDDAARGAIADPMEQPDATMATR